MLQPKKKTTKADIIESNRFLRSQKESAVPKSINITTKMKDDEKLYKSNDRKKVSKPIMKKGGTKKPIMKKGGKKC